MPITIISSRRFNQDTSGAKKSAGSGPVVITDRGRPAHVLLTYEAYQSLSGRKPTIIDLLYSPETADIDVEFPRLNIIPRDVDLS